MRYTITDQAGTNGTITVDSFDVADALRGWFAADEAEVQQAVTDLQAAIERRDPVQWELAEYLGISIAVIDGDAADMIGGAR